ncbi:NAD(P)-binding domain protein [Akanthomyces lecanii RCEF 1005]|uniref:NAD(P)-binding domain protein n=1 Tax=Akanthomyces lecanii RCEF 1005 TaxID=1081108 RepID=A0A168AY43_CORDF|nr:NAD(P)-binding domain protein [Akanthomyces lecanii RCEF 1005]
MSSRNILLVIGAGPRLGQSVADKFANEGYRVALAARSLTSGLSSAGMLKIKADLSDPNSVSSIFQTVHNTWGPPNIVVYNGANRITTAVDDPLSAPLSDIQAARTVGFDSAYLAAQEALHGFKSLPDQLCKAFIYTGNALSQIAIPGVLPFAVGKVSAAMLIEYAANAYGPRGYKFYFADERQSDGRPAALDIDGAAHADMYWELANEKLQSYWLVTFVKNQGRQDFAGVDFQGHNRVSHYKRMRDAAAERNN